MEQILPEACPGEVQVTVTLYVQFIQGSDLPSNIPGAAVDARCVLVNPNMRALTYVP